MTSFLRMRHPHRVSTVPLLPVSHLTVCQGFHTRARASAVCGFVFMMVGEFKWSDVEGSPLNIVAILLSSASLLFTVGVFVAIKFAVIFVGFQSDSCMRVQSSSCWCRRWDYCHWNAASVPSSSVDLCFHSSCCILFI